MRRYIDADELYTEGYCLVRDIHINGALLRDSRSLLDVPTEDVQPVRNGHWTLQEDIDKKVYGWHICSECGAWIGEPTNYCPNCGADMRGEQNGTT